MSSVSHGTEVRDGLPPADGVDRRPVGELISTLLKAARSDAHPNKPLSTKSKLTIRRVGPSTRTRFFTPRNAFGQQAAPGGADLYLRNSAAV